MQSVTRTINIFYMPLMQLRYKFSLYQKKNNEHEEQMRERRRNRDGGEKSSKNHVLL